jgi:hypothetical protein
LDAYVILGRRSVHFGRKNQGTSARGEIAYLEGDAFCYYLCNHYVEVKVKCDLCWKNQQFTKGFNP